jgi:hypothetical protein
MLLLAKFNYLLYFGILKRFLVYVFVYNFTLFLLVIHKIRFNLFKFTLIK